jgi:hypothetical protein
LPAPMKFRKLKYAAHIMVSNGYSRTYPRIMRDALEQT